MVLRMVHRNRTMRPDLPMLSILDLAPDGATHPDPRLADTGIDSLNGYSLPVATY